MKQNYIKNILREREGGRKGVNEGIFNSVSELENELMPATSTLCTLLPLLTILHWNHADHSNVYRLKYLIPCY